MEKTSEMTGLQIIPLFPLGAATPHKMRGSITNGDPKNKNEPENH